MRDIYGIDVSPSLVSRVTDKIMPQVAEWQSRPLEKVYAVVFLDAIRFKVRKDNRIINKAAYSVLGINMAGQKIKPPVAGDFHHFYCDEPLPLVANSLRSTNRGGSSAHPLLIRSRMASNPNFISSVERRA